MYSGILPLRKPPGMTSHDVVGRLRRMLGQRRIGHAGTLDPMARGVLVMLLGAATRASDDAAAHDKTYLAGLRLGLETDTQDIWGRTVALRPAEVTPEQLERALARFRGPIMQTPPMVSAVQVGGQRLYKLARQGLEIDRPARAVTLHTLRVLAPAARACPPLDAPEGDIVLEVVCSKGTYVRTLCHDIGAALGCGGCLSALTRTRSGMFDWAQSLELDAVADLHASGALERALTPADAVYAHLPAVTLSDAGGRLALVGGFLRPAHVADGQVPPPDARCRVYLPGGRFYMVGVGRHTPAGPVIACAITFGNKDDLHG